MKRNHSFKEVFSYIGACY